MSELRALRQRKDELETHLATLQDSRRQLMVQLEGLMKMLKVLFQEKFSIFLLTFQFYYHNIITIILKILHYYRITKHLQGQHQIVHHEVQNRHLYLLVQYQVVDQLRQLQVVHFLQHHNNNSNNNSNSSSSPKINNKCLKAIRVLFQQHQWRM